MGAATRINLEHQLLPPGTTVLPEPDASGAPGARLSLPGLQSGAAPKDPSRSLAFSPTTEPSRGPAATQRAGNRRHAYLVASFRAARTARAAAEGGAAGGAGPEGGAAQRPQRVAVEPAAPPADWPGAGAGPQVQTAGGAWRASSRAAALAVGPLPPAAALRAAPRSPRASQVSARGPSAPAPASRGAGRPRSGTAGSRPNPRRWQGLRRPCALPAPAAGSPHLPLPQPGPPPPAPAVSPDSHEAGRRPDVPVTLCLSPDTPPLSASRLLRPGSARPARAKAPVPVSAGRGPPRPLSPLGRCCPLAAAGRTRWALSRARPLAVAAGTDAPPSRKVLAGPRGKDPREADRCSAF
ncbi:translation initiation factor IF-2-like [Oryx dammah]|uniref:translation initiation factor IF-2-like n=1 Tax=Oryx dammah TaxID=59534 RepID=UPI001A9B3BCD|nr:translation initiation factor IF-2-like [Oryx dammah]